MTTLEKNMEKTAIIVARKGSKRIKSKCLLELNGETLIKRKVKQLQQCHFIDRIIVGSDSDEMLEEGKKAGAETVRRPSYYCDESKVSANDMIKNMMGLIQTDIVVWTHCTNPLLSPETYDRAIQTYLQNLDSYDSLLSVHELKEHLWRHNKPVNYNPYASKHVVAKDLPALYMQDGGIFIQSYENMKANSYFFGKKPYLFKIPAEEYLDINEFRDYLLAQAILTYSQKDLKFINN